MNKLFGFTLILLMPVAAMAQAQKPSGALPDANVQLKHSLMEV